MPAHLSRCNPRRGCKAHPPPHPPPSPPTLPQEKNSKEGGWEKVTGKKRPRLHGEPRHEQRENLTSQRRSPPTIRTPTSTITVCGQCLRPGHKAIECRRDVTYRRCGGVGHKGLACGGARRTSTGIPQENKEAKKAQQQPPHPKEKQPGKGLSKAKTLATKVNNQLPVKGDRQKPEEGSGGMGSQYISLTLISDMMEGLERMRKYI
ncbi:hypothetical protein J5N97_029795 [Dioscorea zingiberensis]|uniref:CCHC-type domain-containing protein n=1 Tax=Dioscorea zingiberensis TaxID=325984 RepID=A0A9D5H3J2_9LILI|nr:hypothetical protein J5N97_029795 [Dioscorea zingiberensis]